MSQDNPTLRELWQLKQEWRNAPSDDDQAQRDTYQAYQEADAKSGFLKGLIVYAAD